MPAFNFFNSFKEALPEKVHNLSSDQLKIALTNVAPSAINTVLADITEIAYTNLSSRDLTVNSSVQSAGIYSLSIADITLSATGGNVETFRYVIIYNDTAAGDPLIGWCDYGQSQTVVNGAFFDIVFNSSGLFRIIS